LWAGIAYDNFGRTVPFFTSAALVAGALVLQRGISTTPTDNAPVASAEAPT
jgi:hypothetical protein